MNEQDDRREDRGDAEDAPLGESPSGFDVPSMADAVFDGHASKTDLAKLADTLRSDSSALSEYIECAGLHSALDWHVTSREPFQFEESDNPHADHAQRVGFEVDIDSELPTLLRRQSGAPSLTKQAAALLAVAASFASCVWLYNAWAPQLGPESPPVLCASISRCSAGANWSVLHAESSPSMRSEIMAGETIHLTSGDVLLSFEKGAEVQLAAPAVLQVLGSDRAIALRGKLTAQVGEEAIGFAIDTPRAQVIDLGTRFGLEVDDFGQTDVVVFEGEVDIAYGPADSTATAWKRRIMRMGEAVRVDGLGDANRIISISSDRFASTSEESNAAEAPPMIVDVRDNIRGDDSWNYYEVVRGGMREDARAYVDRIEHEWNGLDASGMPGYLVGGDFVRMFNNDKWAEYFEIEVTLSAPATLYVLFDDRVPPPEWLTEAFKDTGDDIGLDRGPYEDQNGKRKGDFSSGIGPGVSVEDTLSVWSRVVRRPEVVKLGDPQATHNQLNMYGIVAVPLLESQH